MSVTRSEYLAFSSLISKSTPETLQQALTKLTDNLELGRTFADNSPKFVEIFRVLHPGIGKTEQSMLLFKIIDKLFDACFEKKNTYLGQLHYLADAIIRRLLPDIYSTMQGKHSQTGMHLLYQAASVHHTHCRELFSTLDFSNNALRMQRSSDSEGRKDYVRLATLFLENPEISSAFLSTKYYIASIWRGMSHDDPEVLKAFITAMTNAISKTTQSTRRWVFSDMTLKNIASYPLDENEESKSPGALVFKLLKTVTTGPDSILMEDPARCYCRAIPDIDPPPRNLHMLNFIRDLKPWTRHGDCTAALMIFRQSPDLISHFFSRVNRTISTELTLANLSSFYFVTQVVSQPWPEFLLSMNQFFDEGRSLSLLFESILPSFLDAARLTALLNSKQMLLIKSVLVLLICAVRKFRALPAFLKTPAAYSKLNSAIPIVSGLFSTDSQIVQSFTLKLLAELDRTIPFYLADNYGHLDRLKPIGLQNQLMLVKLLPSACPNKLGDLQPLILNETLPIAVRRAAFDAAAKILTDSGIFEGYESEVPIWVGEGVAQGLLPKYHNKIRQVATKMHQNQTDRTVSPLINAVGSKELTGVLPIFALAYNRNPNDLMNIRATTSDLVLKPLPVDVESTMGEMQWYTLNETAVRLCAKFRESDDSAAVAGLKTIAILDPRTASLIVAMDSVRSKAFAGNSEVDSLVALCAELMKELDDELSVKMLTGGAEIDPQIINRIAPHVDSKFVGELLALMIRAGCDIRPVIDCETPEVPSNVDGIWKWVYEGFKGVDLGTLLLAGDAVSSITDNGVIVDILRMSKATGNYEILDRINIEDYSDEKIAALIADLYPDDSGSLPPSLPVDYLLGRRTTNPVEAFQTTQHEWALPYLLDEIAAQPFTAEVNRLRHGRAAHVLKAYMKNPSETLFKTFRGRLIAFVSKSPESVTEIPAENNALYTEVAPALMRGENLVEFSPEQLKGVCNVLLGADLEVPLKVIIYLATELVEYDGFYELLERQWVSGGCFLFATGETAKFVIQQLESNQRIFQANLARNVAYLQPFHLSHINVPIDTPRFRFLLQFSNFLLWNKLVTPDIFFESGAISVVLRALSSTDEHTRAVGYASLSELYDFNNRKEWKCQQMVAAFLEVLLNAVTEPCMRLTHLLTYFLTSAATVLMKPSHNLYMRVVKFLLGTPALRTNQVPLLTDIFDKPTIAYRNERSYILKMLKNGLAEESDLKMLEHGKVLERLMVLFATPLAEMDTRNKVLDVLTTVAKLGKVPGVHNWVLSVILEPFAVTHIDQLATLALTSQRSTRAESMAFKEICKIIVEQLSESVSIETYEECQKQL